jgi:CheY-like chemotaxis protein
VPQAELLDAILCALDQKRIAEPVTKTAPVIPKTARALRVLLAEDNAINSALTTAILEKRGHSVVHAVNGREAVEAAREPFDLILMDVQMPELDGFAATAQIRANECTAGRRTPIVAMTAHAMAGDRTRCLAAGMDEYVSKPLRKAELLKLLDRVSK